MASRKESSAGESLGASASSKPPAAVPGSGKAPNRGSLTQWGNVGGAPPPRMSAQSEWHAASGRAWILIFPMVALALQLGQCV